MFDNLPHIFALLTTAQIPQSLLNSVIPVGKTTNHSQRATFPPNRKLAYGPISKHYLQLSGPSLKPSRLARIAQVMNIVGLSLPRRHARCCCRNTRSNQHFPSERTRPDQTNKHNLHSFTNLTRAASRTSKSVSQSVGTGGDCWESILW